MALRFDLQSHSTHSDGVLAAAEVVQRAADAGVELLALTDHDTISGVAEAIEAGERAGVRIVPAVEISAVDAGAPVGRELHILGYDIDHTGPPMTDSLVAFLADREKRTLRMRDGLREAGLELDETEIEQRIAQGKPIGRPHLAGAVLNAAGQRAAPARRGHRRRRLADSRLSDRGQAGVSPARDADGRRGRRGDPRGRRRGDLGASLLGHRGRRRSAGDASSASASLASTAWRPSTSTHDEAQTRLLAERCAELGLLSTGSADYHGPDNRLFSRFLAFDTYGLQPNLGSIAD